MYYQIALQYQQRTVNLINVDPIQIWKDIKDGAKKLSGDLKNVVSSVS